MLAPYDLTTQKLLMIIHRSLVEARTLARAGACQQLHDLADAFEELPALMLHWRRDALETVRARLLSYQSKHPTSASDYLSILELNEEEYQAVFGMTGLDPAGSSTHGGNDLI